MACISMHGQGIMQLCKSIYISSTCAFVTDTCLIPLVIHLRLQDTLFRVLRKIATARSKFSSNFHAKYGKYCMQNIACKIVHAKYGKFVKLTNNKIM